MVKRNTSDSMKNNNELPPFDEGAENSTIGALLIDGDKIDEISLTPDDFYIESRQIVFQSMLNLRKRGVHIDETTVSQELKIMGKGEDIIKSLFFCISATPTSLDLYWYADIVKRLSTYRRLISASEKIKSMGYEASGDLEVSLDKADEILLDVRKSSGALSIFTPKDVSDMAIQRYTDLSNKEGGVSISTGLKDLDDALGGGFYGGDMIVLAGRPSIGKTELTLTLAKAASLIDNVLYCSAEMSVESIVDRIVAGRTKIPLPVIRKGGYEPADFKDIMGEPIQYLADLNVYYYRDMPMTTAKILQAAITMKLRFGLSLLVIDYLGILDDEYGNNGYERVGYISRKVKQIARVLDVPVVAVHQLNREVEHATDKKPQLKDLRDSGKLEEDADVVLLLYRDSYYDKETVNKETEIIIAKHRQGGSANQYVAVMYDSESHEYKNLYREGN